MLTYAALLPDSTPLAHPSPSPHRHHGRRRSKGKKKTPQDDPDSTLFASVVERFAPPALAASDIRAGDPSGAAGTPAAAAFDPATEYQELVDALASKGRFRGSDGDRPRGPDPYHHLVGRERRVLDTIDRVTADRTAEQDRERSILGMSIAAHAERALAAFRGLLDDATSVRRPLDAWRVLYASVVTDDQRRLYLGVTLTLIALIVLAVAG
jgi:hypothetical protein